MATQTIEQTKEASMTLADYYKLYLISKAGGVFIPWAQKWG